MLRPPSPSLPRRARALCVAGVLLAALALGAGTAGADDPAPPPAPAEIDAAIERGVAWLLAEQKPGGPWATGSRAVGHTALAALTLQHCGLAEDQPSREARRLARALRWLDGQGPARGARREDDTRTYEASLLLMVLRARGRAEDRPRMQRLADLLCASQAKNGQWWYDGKAAPHIDVGDNSNTQFATLALGQAHGEGLRVPAAALRRTLGWWQRTPGTDGGFGYASGGAAKSAATGSMTAAGIACLAIGRAALGEAAPAGAEAVQARAVDFLAQVFSVTRNHGPAIDRRNERQRQTGRGWLHYYLWTVERAMVLAGHERLGGRDWYAEGARRLLDTQARDGSWRQEHPLYATCFALLFLTRAADPPRAFTPRPTPAGTVAPTTPRAGGAGGPQAPSPAVPDAAAWLDGPLPPGELAARCRAAGPRSLPPLVAALAHPDRARRARAWEALVALLPEARLRGADRHPLARGRLALWLRLQGRFLVVREGRFVEP